MYCSHCGNKIEDMARFCPSCGQPKSTTGTIATPVATAQDKIEKSPWYKSPRNQIIALLLLLCVLNYSSFTYTGIGTMIGRVLAVVFVGIILANIYFLIKRKRRTNNERWASILFTSFGVYLVLLFLSLVAG